ncbi:MAG TPA: cysteine desulfurase family protein [Microthrixaceae bacterium]|nr:cysteine desulfurase family protein [Microthrixaceae bacterium]
MSDRPIYLDYNATTPVAGAVFDRMRPWFTEDFANPASTHRLGQVALAAVQEARAAVAGALSVPANSVVFTSGATEASNLAIRGVTGPVVVAATEHKAVLDTAKAREFAVASVDRRGRLDLDQLDRVARGAALISIMLANNETGVVHDLATVVEIGRRHGCLVHTDATQAFGKIKLDLQELGVDLASVSAHKIYGPKGIGALYVRRGVTLDSVMTGGGHERGFRAGTLNVPGIVGFGVAAERLQPAVEAVRSRALLDRFVSRLGSRESFVLHSDHRTGLPNTLSLRFPGADAEAVIANAPEICISAGSACTAAIPEPSHVLLAMGVPSDEAFESLRISVGAPTTDEEVDQAALLLARSVRRGREPNAGGVCEGAAW